VIGVAGGSLGSVPLSAIIEKRVREMGGNTSKTAGRRIVFVALGERYDTAFDNEIQFIGRRWDMAPFYSLCDAVICRAGASTLAELAAFGIPALTIPWADAADAHQEANALAFSSMTGDLAWIERERNERDLEEAFEKLLKHALSGRRSDCGFMNDAASSALWRFSEEKYPGLKHGGENLRSYGLLSQIPPQTVYTATCDESDKIHAAEDDKLAYENDRGDK
jgi:UDP-N-acetylglucosamine:LPS N-acetylglucosamine transferase